MALLIVVLVVVKRKVEGGVNFGVKMKKNKAPKVEIVYQKSLDIKTKIQLLQIEDYQYLIMSSPSQHLLLDKYEVSRDKKKIDENQEKFNSILSSTEENFKNSLKRD
jgi:flagellar biogenesis protein FliO